MHTDNEITWRMCMYVRVRVRVEAAGGRNVDATSRKGVALERACCLRKGNREESTRETQEGTRTHQQLPTLVARELRRD